jgi:hypothetical protein
MRDAKGMQTIDGMEYLASIPEGEIIVDMTVHQGTLYVASEKHIYRLVDNKRLERLNDV